MFAVITLTDKEFKFLQEFVFKLTGIYLSDDKKSLVQNRLAKRLRHYNFNSFTEYNKIVKNKNNSEERQMMVDLISTNETHFFREPKHFDFLAEEVIAKHNRTKKLRIWCAAASTGEEPYTLAMVLHEQLGDSRWEILASDINMQVLKKAANGIYPMAQTSELSKHYLKRYCLKGKNNMSDFFKIDKSLQRRIDFCQINLNEALPDIGFFDCVFLRNVFIYFSDDTKKEMLARILPVIKNNGYLILGHAESLNRTDLKTIQSSIYKIERE